MVFLLHFGMVEQIIYLFLGAFPKLRKTIISFVMSVRPSDLPHGTARLEQEGLS